MKKKIDTVKSYRRGGKNHYAELVKQGKAILSGELEDDTVLPILYGLDPTDALDDDSTWGKANPGLEHGQPDLVSLRRSWNTMKRSPMGRGEFARYHAARCDENVAWREWAQVDKRLAQPRR